jgi:hypothetical protein
MMKMGRGSEQSAFARESTFSPPYVTLEQRPFAGAKGDFKAIHADLRTLSNTFGLVFGAVLRLGAALARNRRRRSRLRGCANSAVVKGHIEPHTERCEQ